MKNFRNSTLKALLVVTLLAPAVFADGDMGSGGFADDTSSVPVKTVRTAEGDMGSGGRTSADSDQNYLDWVLNSVAEYFDWAI